MLLKYNTFTEASKEAQKMQQACAGLACYVRRSSTSAWSPTKGKSVEHTTYFLDYDVVGKDAPDPRSAQDTDYTELSEAGKQRILDSAIMSFRRSDAFIQANADLTKDVDCRPLTLQQVQKLSRSGVYPETNLAAARSRARFLLRNLDTKKVTLARHPSRGQEVWCFVNSRPRAQEHTVEVWQRTSGWYWATPQGEDQPRWYHSRLRSRTHTDDRQPFYVEQCSSIPAVIPFWTVTTRDMVTGDNVSLTIRAMSHDGARRKAEAARPGWPIVDVVEIDADWAEAEEYDSREAWLAYDEAEDTQELVTNFMANIEEAHGI